MEIVIPSRDHGVSTYRYTWDENGEVMQVTRVTDQQQPQNDTQIQQPQMAQRSRIGRQTVQWPFQSIATEASLATHPERLFTGSRRPATWEPKRILLRSRDSDSDTLSVAQDLVPDYVINYIRGETPETVARRKRNGGKLGERGVDVVTPGHRPQHSRVAEFEGFFDDRSSGRGGRSERSRGFDGDEEDLHILSGCGARRSDRGWRRLTDGWRGGVALNVLLACLILVAGFVSLIFAVSKVSLFSGESVIFSGSCATASNITEGVHVVINVFAVVLLAGANYVFQVLSSPTRREVDVAHEKKKWLDIGIASVRNFAHIARSRVLLAVLVLLVAVITQIIYNAVIFTSQTAVDYNMVFVTQSFLKGAPFSNGTTNNEGKLSRLDILALQDLANRNALVNLTAPECISQFSGAYESEFKAALLVTNIDSQTSSLVQTTVVSSPDRPAVFNSRSAQAFPLDQSAIQFCLAQPADEAQTCNVSLNGSLLGIVALLNLISVATVAAILFRPCFHPLVSLGDALNSFLRHPDPTTSGSCLMTKQDVWQSRWGFREAKYWVPHDHTWFWTPSFPRWCLGILFWLALTSLSAAALGLTVHADPTGRLSAFGTASSYAVYLLPSTTPASGAALVASLPQLLLAALYLSTNSIMSTYYLSHESSLFALPNPRPLRVTSDPEGSQTTSLFLTLPRPWSWFLVTLFISMGFVLSQSVFVVSIHLTPLTSSSASTSSTSLTAIGFSGTGLLILLALLVVLATAVLGLGFRRATPAVLVNGQAVGNPLAMEAGSCSAVLSARCHPAPDEPDLWKRPLTWGVVEGGGGVNVSHCTYTAGQAAELDISRSYA